MRRSMATSSLVAGVATLATVVGLAPGVSQARPSAHAATKTVTVTAVDYKFTLSATKAKPGKVTFKIANKGETAHDFKIGGKTSSLISPGGHTSITVTFKKAGKYQYLCTVPGHAALGMKGMFTIT